MTTQNTAQTIDTTKSLQELAAIRDQITAEIAKVSPALATVATKELPAKTISPKKGKTPKKMTILDFVRGVLMDAKKPDGSYGVSKKTGKPYQYLNAVWSKLNQDIETTFGLEEGDGAKSVEALVKKGLIYGVKDSPFICLVEDAPKNRPATVQKGKKESNKALTVAQIYLKKLGL